MGVPNAASLASFGRSRGRPVGSYKPSPGASPTPNSFTRTATNASNASNNTFVRTQRILPSNSSNSTSNSNNSSPHSLIPGFANSSSITIQSVGAKGGLGKGAGHPSISITPLPRGGAAQASARPQTPTRDASGKPSFVICEICDGYIKDLE